MGIETIYIPDVGGESEVIEICVAVGDSIAEEDSLCVLESDKASMEVPSPKAGVVKAILLKVGDQANEGVAILELEVAGAGDSPVESAPVAAAEAASEPVAPVAPAAAPAVSVSAEQEVRVPDLGGASDVECIEVCVSVGDVIEAEQSIIVLETDKASMEVPSPCAGKVISLAVKAGDTVNVGDLVLMLEVAGGVSNEAAPSASAAEPEHAAQVETVNNPPVFQPPQQAQPAQQASAAASSKDVYAGPAVRMLARELEINLAEVSGTGPRGRVSKDDLHQFIKARLKQPVASAAALVAGSGIPVIPDQDYAQFGPVRIEKMSKLHRITAQNMQRSWLNVPHVTQFDDADITELEEFRASLKEEAKKRGTGITPMPFLLKAAAAALKANPNFNVSLLSDGESIVYKDYIHIGMAVDTPAGLMVPVIRDVDRKSIWDLSVEIAEMAQKAKDRKLKPQEMQGGCFTISSLGGIGGTGFTPIVNAPEVAILGVSRLDVKPKWDGKQFVPRKMLPLCLSYDHRAINGGDAGRFLTYLGTVLADIRRLVL